MQDPFIEITHKRQGPIDESDTTPVLKKKNLLRTSSHCYAAPSSLNQADALPFPFPLEMEPWFHVHNELTSVMPESRDRYNLGFQVEALYYTEENSKTT